MAFDNRINRRIFSRMSVAEKSRSLVVGLLTACLLTIFFLIPEIL
jgi:hypothetical protein